jgi:short-subunit dehydrogenase
LKEKKRHKLASYKPCSKLSPAEARKAVEALFQNQAVCIPGLINKLTVAIMQLIPQWAVSITYRKSNLFDQGKSSLG